MMLEIRTLEDIPLSTIATVFNQAFADYIIPMQLTEALLYAKMHGEHISLRHSAGAFDGTALVGFMLIATGEIYGCKTLYNAGTGVLPLYRGQKLTERMYDWLKEHYGEEWQYLLEVITGNRKAIKVYHNAGMQERRLFSCFKGSCIATPAEGIILQKRQLMPVFDAADFWDYEPSWQNSNTAIKSAPEEHHIYVVTNGGRLLGYIVFSEKGRLKQMAVRKDQRRQRVGTTLLAAMSRHMPGKEIKVINADNRDAGVTAFFQSNGLQLFLQQYEMSMP